MSRLDGLHLGQDRRRFIFQRGALHGVILFAQLAGFVLEVQVAQVFVGRFLALLQIAQPRLLFARSASPGR